MLEQRLEQRRLETIGELEAQDELDAAALRAEGGPLLLALAASTLLTLCVTAWTLARMRVRIGPGLNRLTRSLVLTVSLAQERTSVSSAAFEAA